MKNELLVEMDYALLWDINELDKIDLSEDEEKEEYLLIENPINRIKNMNY